MTLNSLTKSWVVCFDKVEIFLFPFLIAAGAYPMRWVSRFCRLLQGKDMKTRPWSYQLIALLFLIPAFKLHKMLFKCVYFLNQRQLMRLGLHQAALSFADMVSQFDHFRFKQCCIAHTNERLDELIGRLQASDGLNQRPGD